MMMKSEASENIYNICKTRKLRNEPAAQPKPKNIIIMDEATSCSSSATSL